MYIYILLYVQYKSPLIYYKSSIFIHTKKRPTEKNYIYIVNRTPFSNFALALKHPDRPCSVVKHVSILKVNFLSKKKILWVKLEIKNFGTTTIEMRLGLYIVSYISIYVY